MTMTPNSQPCWTTFAASYRGAAFLSILFLLLLVPVVPALADAAAGAHVSLTAQADELLPNDEVVVRFRIEAQGAKAELLRDKVNRISRAVSERLRREKGVVQTTLGRIIQPVWHYDSVAHKQAQDGWRLVQSAQAVSTELDAVPEWVDAIERAGAHLDSLQFRVSRHTMNVARERLRARAISEFRRRAAATAKALDAFSFRILNLNTGTAVPRLQPLQTMALAKAVPAAVPPALEAGESRITVTVSGEILLPAKDYPVK